MDVDERVTAETTDLLRHLIRNGCVNDGTPGSGDEIRSADLIAGYLEGPGLDLSTYDALPGRRSLVARIEGTDPAAPTLLLMGHTDVVPANPDGWRRDPYGGELVEGEVWGRGATDMLNTTASMAVATRRLARSGFRPRGTLVYLAVADEEAMGTYGAKWLVEHEADAMAVDYVITEGGGSLVPTPSGPKVTVAVAEKGIYWTRIAVTGTPAHASRPLRTDNALVKAAEVVRRIAAYRPATDIHPIWRAYVEGLGLDPDLSAALLDAERLWDTAEHMDSISMARTAHACTHTTFAPTIIQGGVKTNIIPDRVELEIDIRTLPGQTGADVRMMLDEIVGPDLASSVEVVGQAEDPSTASPMGSPLWDAMADAARRLNPEATLVPSLMAGGTDARFFRRKGITAYGFALLSGRIPLDEMASMFHGDDERIDTESLRLSTELWEGLSRSFLA